VLETGILGGLLGSVKVGTGAPAEGSYAAWVESPGMGETAARRLLIETIYIVSMASSAIVIALLPPQVSGDSMHAILAILILGLAIGIPVIRRAERRSLGGFLSIALLNAAIVLPEALLRSAHFSYQTRIQFGFPAPDSYLFLQPDKELFWRLRVEADQVNSLGFPVPEPAPERPANVRRILYLGDSCTQLGWPRFAEALLNSRAIEAGSPERFDSAILAVAGYTSHQGVVLAERYTERLAGDAATVYFGWNDHWRAWGASDSEKSKTVITEIDEGMFGRLYQKLRLVQFIAWMGNRLFHPNAKHSLDVPRVSEDEFRRNLERIRDYYAVRHLPVFLITAPTTFYAFGVPSYLREMQFIEDDEEARVAHARYCEIVREVATGDRVHLVDLEREWGRLEPQQLKALFMDDGIHLSQLGMAMAGQRVATAISEVMDEKEPSRSAGRR
jgi:lysophospholipase L1-like esterase